MRRCPEKHVAPLTAELYAFTHANWCDAGREMPRLQQLFC